MMSSPSNHGHKKKFSYFKTLPDNIAQSPTGVAKISHGPFPSLDPSKHFKSVYERAGFDVFKGDTGTPRLPDHKGRKAPEMRSQSTSQLASGSPGTLRHEKRNISEFFPAKTAGRGPTGLTIDSKLANSSGSREVLTQDLRTPSTTKSVQRLQSSVPTSAVSSQHDLGSTHSFSPSRNYQVPGSVYSSASPQQIGAPVPNGTRSTSRDFHPKLNHSASYNREPSIYSTHSSSYHSINPDINPNRNHSPQRSQYSAELSQHSPKRNSLQPSLERIEAIPEALTSSERERELELEIPYTRSTNSAAQQDQAAISHIVPKRAPPPVVSPIPPQQERYDDFETSSDTVNFNPGNTTVEKVLDNIIDAVETDNVVNVISGIEASSISSLDNPLAPKNQHFNFESQIPGSYIENKELLGNDDEEDSDINENLTDDDDEQDSDINNNLADEDDDEDSDINNNLTDDDEDSDSDINNNLTDDDDDVNKEEYRSPEPTIEDFNADRQALEPSNIELPPQLPAHQTPDLSIRVGNHGFNNSQNVSAYEASRFRTSNYSMNSPASLSFNTPLTPVFNQMNPAISVSDTDPQQYNQTGQYRDLTESVYEDLENQLGSLTMKSKTLPENNSNSLSANDYQTPMQLQMHSVKQVLIDDEFQTPNSTEDAFTNSNKNIVPPAQQLIHEPTNFNDSQYLQEKNIIPQVKYPAGEGPCRKCGLEIETKPIYSKSGELSGQWHRSCFTCTLCDIKFNKNTNCFVLKDEPYCEYHFHLQNNSLCQICELGIVGECLENDATGRFHLACFKCTNCCKGIINDYVSINGKIYCEACSLEYSNSSTSKIEKRRTRLGFI